ARFEIGKEDSGAPSQFRIGNKKMHSRPIERASGGLGNPEMQTRSVYLERRQQVSDCFVGFQRERPRIGLQEDLRSIATKVRGERLVDGNGDQPQVANTAELVSSTALAVLGCQQPDAPNGLQIFLAENRSQCVTELLGLDQP